MASFVLAPPERLRVVSFFITARMAGQSDRAAFLEAMLNQLAEFVGQPPPPILADHHRVTWFWDLLEQAALLCLEAGGRLALVIDGLDEDRGIGYGEDEHSIAALLPAALPAGVRVVVAGRPDPPVPPDVSADHPLRDPAIMRRLRPSPEAKIMRDAARRELSGLLADQGSGREILGLVSAAGGGLSCADLAALSGEPIGQVESTLASSAGRTFSGRPAQWGGAEADDGPVFILSHEELQLEALRCLHAADLARWRNALHTWADRYRDSGWPAGTPEYLLRGYLKMLRERHDLTRITALATDARRLDRMLDVSGGDAAAIADISTVQEHIWYQEDPDLTASIHLSYHRQDLIRRNSLIPESLPAAWAALGSLNRAESLARSIDDENSRIIALSSISDADEYSGLLLDEAENLARSSARPSGHALLS